MCLPIEPYKIEREWTHAGLRCAVVLAREAQHRCGYVRVPPEHPAHGKGYDSVDVSVHGGLTFSGLEPCQEHPDGQGWWLGFDCAHSGDAMYDPNAKLESLPVSTRELIKIHQQFGGRLGEQHYWTKAEVVTETEQLAEQLAKLGKEVGDRK